MIDASASTIALAFRCASPALSNGELATLRQAILDVPRTETGFARLKALQRRVPVPAVTEHVRNLGDPRNR